ncbi:MAG: hypothetical protein A2Y93_00620 [Chloroflexi bacterium RBG_13_68_17]|nr:MAG: hypothetical protein A2Y93_00620 [Chloroflexi bacterium RBG_13_68_17]
MANDVMTHIAGFYQATHAQVLALVGGLEDGQLVWRPNPTTPSIAFHVWHLTRWADYLQEMIGDGGSQLWESEGLAAAWGLEPANLGFAQTGLGLGADASDALVLPKKETLLGYAREAFALADQAVAAIDDEQFHRRVRDLHQVEGEETEVGEAVLNWLKHDNRHLGMIECMLGVQGRRGTATR